MASPHLLTTRDLIRSLPIRVTACFAKGPFWDKPLAPYARETHKEAFDRLMLLDLETCSEDDVRRCANWLVGWIRPRCQSCGRDVPEVIVFGYDFDDGETDDYMVCRDCVRVGCTLLDIPLLISAPPQSTEDT